MLRELPVRNGRGPARSRTHRKGRVAIAVAALAAIVVGGPFVYIHVVSGKAPARLGLSAAATPAATTAASSASGSTDGTWAVTSGSQVGYRVTEVLFGQGQEAAGRTSSVKGSIAVSGTTVRSGSFTVDMTSVTSDQARRDAQFNGRIMDTAAYPTSTFTFTDPVDLGSIPADRVTRTVTVKGRLSLHGTTKAVNVKITGWRNGNQVQVSGSIPVTFAYWGIPNPSFGPVTTEDHGVLEFALSFTHS